MDIIHLVYFIEVAQQESFTKAAKNLYVSQSTISKLIKNLENELGTALFHRTSKQTNLTDAGKLLFVKAKLILDTLKDITAEFSDLVGIPQGRLKIGIPPMVQILFSKAIAEFNSLYPQISIDLVEVGSRKVEQGISEGTLDAGIVVLPTRIAEKLAVIPFVEDPLMLIVHSNHRLANKPLVDIEELSNESFVMYQEDFALHDHILDKCKEFGFEPKIVCETAQWDFMVDIVASKLAIAFLPQIVCRKLDSKSIQVLPLATDLKPWHLAIAWKKNTLLSYPAKIWLEYIFQLFEIPLKKLTTKIP